MKRIASIFLSLVLLLSLAACGTDKKNTDNTNTVTATPVEMEQKIIEAIGADNYLCDTDIEESWLQNSYQLDMSKVESYVAKQNAISSVNPDTLIILKTKDGYADQAAETLNTYFAQVVSYIRQYPFGTAKVLNARLYRVGDYVLYILAGAGYDGEDSEAENKLALSEYAKIDEAVKSIFGTLPENLAVVPEDDGTTGGFIAPEA